MSVKASPSYITARKKAHHSKTELLVLFQFFVPLLMFSDSSAKSQPTNSCLSANDGVELTVYPLLSHPSATEASARGDLQNLSEQGPVTLY